MGQGQRKQHKGPYETKMKREDTTPTLRLEINQTHETLHRGKISQSGYFYPHFGATYLGSQHNHSHTLHSNEWSEGHAGSCVFAAAVSKRLGYTMPWRSQG
ncbi:unnamed protein product [Pieris brassicae]|uniref:Uncharacterized protein n=1 Tax=Pieris brassicae TaxID=7116 RepID=A0A9P0X2Z2_PIEBR|nr:unnamed protein product [Pieris brassicae]